MKATSTSDSLSLREHALDEKERRLQEREDEQN
jgi:hypothetical protein